MKSLLRVGKVVKAGEDDEPGVRHRDLERIAQIQPVGGSHTDIGYDKVGMGFPDHRQGLLVVVCGSHNFVGNIKSRDQLDQMMNDQLFVVHQYDF